MTASLEDVLAKAGLRVGAAEFLGLVEDVASRLSPQDPDPSHYFSPRQRAALTEAGLDLTPRTGHEPDARARTVAAQAVLTESALSAAEAARFLGIDPSRVRHKLAHRRLTGWKEAGGWRLPAWQFTPAGLLPGLEIVLSVLPADQPPLVVASFMTTRQDDLVLGDAPVTPREWLLAGGTPTPVAALAAVLGTPF
ncbi:MAG TPA: DNA-binding protein [Amycolatopsis sp.]|nr:DNA-binding protein [Amycolatopsis sp.]